MYVGQASLDVPLTTVQQDPLATLPSNIPGLTLNAPDIVVGQVETPSLAPLSVPAFFVVATAILLFLPKRNR